MKLKCRMIAILLVGLLLQPTVQCFASAVNIPTQEFVISGTKDNGYRYDLGEYGGFTTNVLNNQTYESAYFQFDDATSFDILRNDDLFPYENGDVLIEPGKYELYVFSNPSGDSSYGSLEFTIRGMGTEEESQLDDDLLKSISNIPNIEMINQELTFTYNEDTRRYQQWIRNTLIATTNIPNGMITTDAVHIELEDLLIVSCYKNGAVADLPEDGLFKEPANYRIDINEYSKTKGEEGMIYTASFYFTIIASVTSQLGVVYPPEGFAIQSARHGNHTLECDPNHLFLNKDGVYKIDFVSPLKPELNTTLSFKKDTTAPFITFDQQVVSKKNVKAPITFVASEENTKLRILHAGIEITGNNNTLHNGGSYQIIVEDQIGNSRSYTLFLENSYRLFDIKLVYAFVIFVIAFIVWIIITRKRYSVL